MTVKPFDRRVFPLGRQRHGPQARRGKFWSVMLTVADVALCTVTELTLTSPPKGGGRDALREMRVLAGHRDVEIRLPLLAACRV